MLMGSPGLRWSRSIISGGMVAVPAAVMWVRAMGVMGLVGIYFNVRDMAEKPGFWGNLEGKGANRGNPVSGLGGRMGVLSIFDQGGH